jgi:hypothetical protein
MHTYEFITIEEVAERLHVSRATLFNWMQKGIFTQGKHFFKRGRVLRFIWGDDLVTALMGDSPKIEAKPIAKPLSRKNDSPLNWDY